MADDVVASLGTLDGAKFATDDDGTRHWPYTKVAFGANNTQTPVSTGAAALPIQDGGNSITVDGTVGVSGSVVVDGSGVTQPVSDGGGTLSIDDGAGSITVDGTVAVTGVATSAKQDTQTALLAGGLPAALAAGGGLKVEGIAGGVAQPVSLASVPSHAVTNAGTFVNQENGPALTSLQLIDDTIFADDAAFTIGTSKVTMAGGAVVAHGASPDAADAGDAAAPLMNRHRILFTQGGHPNSKSAVYLWTASTTDDNVLPAIAGGTKYAITRITVTLDQATTVGVACRLGFGTASLPTLPTANADAVDDVLFYHPGMVPGTMHSVGDGSGILGVGGDGAELRITAGATTGGTGVVVVTYYPIES